ASAQDPDAALAFVDFLVNSPDAGEILSIERGVPGNLTVREAITPDLDDANLMAVDYLEAIEDELGTSSMSTTQGGGAFEDVPTRACQDLLYGRMTPAEAGQRLVDDLDAALS